MFPAMARLDWRRRASLAGLTADPFHLTLAYTGDPVPCCLPAGGKYATYTVTGLADVLQKHNDTEDVLARFHLDASGMVKVASVEALRVFNETETVSKQVVDEEAGVPLMTSISVVCCAFVPQRQVQVHASDAGEALSAGLTCPFVHACCLLVVTLVVRACECRVEPALFSPQRQRCAAWCVAMPSMCAEAEAQAAEAAAAEAAAANGTDANATSAEGNATASNGTVSTAAKDRKPKMKTVQVPKTVCTFAACTTCSQLIPSMHHPCDHACEFTHASSQL